MNAPNVRRGFTLMEVLVVIVIIVILAGILIPVVGNVRKAAYGAKTQAHMAALTTAIQAYFQDYSAYPGPLGNDQIYQPNAGLQPVVAGRPLMLRQNGATGAFPNPERITGAENVALGIYGGLLLDLASNQFCFESTALTGGKGPGVLNANATVASAAQYRAKQGAYLEAKPNELSKGSFVDAEGTAAMDTVIPEPIDDYPSPMPFLYARARVGAPGVAFDRLAPPPAPLQYQLQDVIGYTSTDIGVGKDTGVYKAVKNPAGKPNVGPDHHGLRTVDPTMTLTTYNGNPPGQYPYDFYAYVLNPSVPGTPRQKDGYILIAAGRDRIYGTEDDVTSFGSVGP